MHSKIKLINQNSASFRLKGRIDEIGHLELILEELSSLWGLDDKIKFKLNLVLEELITNIIFHGFENNKEDNYILLDLGLSENEIEICIKDNAKEFNPLLMESEPAIKPIEEQEIGGLGIHLVKNMTVNMNYNRNNDLNQLTLSIILEDGNK